MKQIKISRLNLVLIVIIVFLIGFIFGGQFAPTQYREEIVYQNNVTIIEKSIELGIPAVDSQGNGVIGILSTTVRPGTGLVLVNINDVLAQYDTQYSGRVAAKIAGDYTNTNMSSLDVIYNIKVNATIIEGPSAGASMTASIILALKNGIPKNVMITGTIEEDGSIGTVGAIYEKAAAAKEAGAEIFLVPEGQSVRYGYKKERACESFDSMTICRIKYVADDTNIGETLNLTVAEVKNISEAMDYFLKK